MKVEEEKGVVDFVVDEVYKDFKNTYGDLPKKKSPEIKPKARKQEIQIEQLMESDKPRQQLYEETLAKLLATKGKYND
jgi:hypothetical protein|tara:strand:+ start:207 stop:440 length:234 start_codon:yes stop_codon:yes gene_type:complete